MFNKKNIYLIISILSTLSLLSASDTSPIYIPIDPLLENAKESPTLLAKRLASERRAQGLEVYDWGLGASPFSVPEEVVQSLRDHAHYRQYGQVNGISELAEAILNYYKNSNQNFEREGLLVAPGLKQLLYDVQRAYDGEIIHVTPYWVSYPQQSAILGKYTRVIHTKRENDYKLQANELEELCRENLTKARLLIFNHPVNPTGVAYSTSELKEIAKVCKRHDIIVVADEVYLACHHQGSYESISDYLPEQTIRMSSLSKEFSAGGWRLGWALFPKSLYPLKQAMAILGSNSYSLAPVPIQYAAATALKGSESLDLYRKNTQKVLRSVSKMIESRLEKMNLHYATPSAAWYFFIDFENHRNSLEKKGIFTSQDLVEKLIDDLGIVFVSGEAFGLNPEELCVRASAIDYDGDITLAIVEKLADSEEFDTENVPCLSRIETCLDLLETWLLDEQQPFIDQLS